VLQWVRCSGMLADQHKQQACHISGCKPQARKHCAGLENCKPSDKHQTGRSESRPVFCWQSVPRWSQAVLGMIGQGRTDRGAPCSECECTHQQHWVHAWSWSHTYSTTFIHLAVHKGVLSLWIVQLQTEHQCSSLHSQLLHLSIDWAILGVRQLHHTCNILAGVSGVRPLSCGVAASGWTCPHLRQDE